MVTEKLREAIGRQVAFQRDHLIDCMWSDDYEGVAMIDPRRMQLTTDLPVDWGRRQNDVLAAAYIHAVAFNHGSGDDCMDEHGSKTEVKLTTIYSRDMFIGANGQLYHRGSEDAKKGKLLTDRCRTKWRVYDSTAEDHHNQTTAYILVSGDHKLYIEGYVMHGDTVKGLLSTQAATDRSISLGQFQEHGYAVNSCLPHLGWNEYYQALADFVRARDGFLQPDEAREAIYNWHQLLEEKNWKRNY